MRRLFSITLLLLLALPLLASFASQDAEGRLPACCRRGGAHHCMWGMESASGPSVGQRCASFPQAPALATHVHDWVSAVVGLRLGGIVAQGASVAWLQMHAESTLSDSRWTRGPPLTSLLQFGAICLVAGCCLSAVLGFGAREARLSLRG